jgi:S-adenosylmethionine:tRNA ribosyltransferase-isomerase
MLLSDFDYPLPPERIAHEGLAKRDEARLLVLNPDGSRSHRQILNLPEYLKAGDLVILNDTRVAPAKLIGKKSTGGKIDCLLLPETSPNGAPARIREALLRGSSIRPGTELLFEARGETLKATVLEKLGGARHRIEWDRPEAIEQFAQLPLPPYIKKALPEPDRYQTVYSRETGSLAAPTAGLHFTPELMKRLEERGVEFARLTLHIGIGTFAPIRTPNLDDWKMHPEYYRVLPETAEKINRAIAAGRRCFGVGTTCVRTLETVTKNGRVEAGEGWTDIFIKPGHRFQFPYAGLLTNFHLPESTLVILISALAGRENLLSAYAEAVEKQYRFYSLGDSMLIFLPQKGTDLQ